MSSIQPSTPSLGQAPAPDPPRPTSGLPTPLTALVGREREAAAVAALLGSGEARLVTLTGPGGVGKTRLALRVASDLYGRFPGGIWFVPLAPIADPALVLPTIAYAVGVRDPGDRLLTDQMAVLLGDRAALLVLDNFEQVVTAAPVVAELLARCPWLKVLVTSRARLRVSGEHAFPVPPLMLPDPVGEAEIGPVRAEAVQLFVARAQEADPAFTLSAANAAAVAETCRRLDGLPLAIELAAAWVPVLPPRAMVVRLQRRLPLLTDGPRDLPARLRTMRDAIAWSHDLLTTEEQVLFRRLAVFVGGFRLEAAEVVCAAEAGRGSTTIEGIASLVDKSLIRREEGTTDGPRFGMLETVREFGLERLVASGEEASIRRAHAVCYLELAERAWEARTTHPGTKRWVAQLQPEHDDLRAALTWLDEAGAGAEVAQLAGALTWYWYFGDHWGEGRTWLERALTQGDADPSPSRARALFGAALVALYQGDDNRAVALADQSLALSRDLDDASGAAAALFVLGVLAEDRGEYDRAVALLEEARAADRDSGASNLLTLVTYHLGIVTYGRGDHAGAAVLLEEVRDRWREEGDTVGTATVLSHLALMATEQGDAACAAANLADAVGLLSSAAVKHKRTVAFCLAGAAVIAASIGQAEHAARLFGAAAGVNAALGSTPALPERAAYERATAMARAQLGVPAFEAAWRGGAALSLEQAIAEAGTVAADVPPGTVSLAASTVHHGLTAREMQVLRLLAEGRTDRQIADALYLSPRTVHHHVASLLAKLGGGHRTAAVAAARAAGLLPPSPPPSP